MDQKTYIDTVLSVLRHVTGGERAAIQAELKGHIEDHMEGLMELGYEPELAEERTLAAMGDPKEVGRELNKQYPMRWLVLCWLARILSAWAVFAVLLLALSTVDAYESPVTAVRERMHPDLSHHYDPAGTIVAEEQLDIEVSVGNDIVRVVRVCIYYDGYDISRENLMAYVNVDSYDRRLLGLVSDKYLILENQEGGRSELLVSGSNRWWRMGDGAVPIEPDDTWVTLRYEAYGESAAIRIPLPEGEQP